MDLWMIIAVVAICAVAIFGFGYQVGGYLVGKYLYEADPENMKKVLYAVEQQKKERRELLRAFLRK